MADQPLPNLRAALGQALPAELGGTWTVTAEDRSREIVGFTMGLEIERVGVPWCRRTALVDRGRDTDPRWIEAITTEITEQFRYAIARTN